MGITIDELLRKPFSVRSFEEKLQIVADGRPRPVWQNRIVIPYYDQEHWLTGCEKRQALFCWPCLLFAIEHNVFNSADGFRDIRNFVDASTKHKKAASHVQSVSLFQQFILQNLKPVNQQPVVNQQTDFSKRNRDLARRIVDVVYLAVTQQYPPPMDTKNYKPLKVEDCINSLRLLKDFDMYNVTDDAINMLETFPQVVTDMVSAMASVMKAAIKEEVQLSTYVSLVLSEHSDIDLKSQISPVLRYMKGGKIIERFVGFADVYEYKSSAVIHQLMSKIIQEYGIAERFVAYSCDGAVLASSSHLKTLKVKIRDDYPRCLFVPCYYHGLDYVLEKSVSRNKDCKLFFRNMDPIKSYFQGNSETCKALTNYLGSDIIEANSDDFSHSNFFRVLKTYRKPFIKFFDFVVQNYEECDSSDIAKALGFQHILKDFQTIFLLEVFSKLFDNTYTLGEMLSSSLPESVYGSHVVANLIEFLQRESENGFEQLWVLAVASTWEKEEPKPASLKDAVVPETKMLCRELFDKIIDSIRMEIDVRFSSLHELLFFHILNYEKYGKFVIEHAPLQSLLTVHAPFYDENWIKNEQKVLRGNELFAGKSTYQLMELFVTCNLRGTFKHLFKLAELILSMPCKPAFTSAGPSKLSEISLWSYISENPESVTDLSLLCIERTYLEEIRNRPNFYSEVISKFQEISKTVQFAYS